MYGKHLVDALENYVIKESPDLLAMSTHYRSIYDKLFGKSFGMTLMPTVKSEEENCANAQAGHFKIRE